ncbi:HTH-type transcriptional regulator DmlR [Photobacterium damselae subsp. damselae]|nr:LysR family transcriptional regulator [Photobacterium damselae]TGZ35211.1 HTH-type transcriptional regulator DmlR [Photobacterium damselae subsp. damselae]
MDRLSSIEIFVRAVELGSFAAVAEERGISAQMVGKHIRGLESSLGTKLLAKSTRYQALTAAGEQFHLRCLNILSEMNAAQEDIYRNINEPIGKLKLCCGVNLGISLIAPLLGQFIQQYPKLEIELVLDNNPPDIQRDGFDVIFHDRVEGYEFLVGHQICSYDMVACASPEYLHKYGIPKHPKELEHHQCLKHSTTYHAHRWCFKGPDGEYFLPRISSRFMINSGQAMLAAAKEGAGITIQPRFQVQNDLNSGSLTHILPSYTLPEIELFMLYKPSLRNTSRLILLNDFFMKSMFK